MENFCPNLRVLVSETWKIKVKHAYKYTKEWGGVGLVRVLTAWYIVVKGGNLYLCKTTQLVKKLEFLSLGFYVSKNLKQKM